LGDTNFLFSHSHAALIDAALSAQLPSPRIRSGMIKKIPLEDRDHREGRNDTLDA
jgi:hypothetical protein